MSSRADDLSDHPNAPGALLVEPAVDHLASLLSTLSIMGFDPTMANTYHDAREALSAARPAILVTALKLREYNGLHLVLRGKSVWPDLPALVTSDLEDPVLQAETERLGATFVVMPAPEHELVAAICRTVFRTQHPDPAGVPPIRGPFERRSSDRRGCSLPAGNLRTTERRRSIAEAIRALNR